MCGYIRPHMCAAGLVEVSTLAVRARDVQGQQEGGEEQGKREKKRESRRNVCDSRRNYRVLFT